MAGSKAKNGKMSSQDYMNLLYSDSESDTVPDLKLPPLKGKKPRRRRARQSSEDGMCSLWMLLKTVIVIVLLIAVIALGIVTYLSLQQIRELKDQINSIENKNAGTPEEFQALKAKLMSVNKTVNDMKTGTYGLDSLNKTILTMQKQVTSLTATATELQKTVQESQPDTKEKMAVENAVADLGSSLQSTQSEVTQLKTSHQSLDTQLKDLSDRVATLVNPGGRESGSSAVKVEDMQDVLSQINASYSESIALALTNMDKQEARLDVVDKFAVALGEQVKNSSDAVANLTTSLQQLWQLVLSRQEGSVREESEGEKTTTSPMSLTQLQAQVTQLQLLFQQMQSAYNNLTKTNEGANLGTGTLDIVTLQKDHEQLLAFKTEVYSDISALNASLGMVNGSVGVLNTDIEDLFVKVGLAMSDISNITSVVEGLADFLQRRADKADALAGQTTTPTHVKPTTPPPSEPPASEGDMPVHSDKSTGGTTTSTNTLADEAGTDDTERAV